MGRRRLSPSELRTRIDLYLTPEEADLVTGLTYYQPRTGNGNRPAHGRVLRQAVQYAFHAIASGKPLRIVRLPAKTSEPRRTQRCWCYLTRDEISSIEAWGEQVGVGTLNRAIILALIHWAEAQLEAMSAAGHPGAGVIRLALEACEEERRGRA